MRLLPMLVLLGMVASTATACGVGDDAAGTGDGARVPVVATTTQVADLVRNVGGERVAVRGLLGPNADPHEYEPRPSDAEAIADAAAVFRSGGDLDEWLGDLVESTGADVRAVTLLDRVQRIEGGHEDDDHAAQEGGAEEAVDPHWWHDPRNGVRAVAAIRDTLVRADPGGRAAYEANARAYARRLEQLDRDLAACLGRIPAERRKLVTTHDALGYFAARYDIETIGSVLDSLSTQAQPSAGDARELVAQMREEDVRVLFAESSIAPRLERAIAEEAGARVGGALWADTLGPAGTSGDTYAASLAANADAMVRGFTGGRGGCTSAAAS